MYSLLTYVYQWDKNLKIFGDVKYFKYLCLMKDKIKEILRENVDKNILGLSVTRPNKDSNILYSAVVLDKASHNALVDKFKDLIPDGWDVYAHHMTIIFGKGLEDKDDIGKVVRLSVTKIGLSDMAIAVGVEGYPSKNAIPHITLAVNPNGGKPVMSNDITKWQDVKPFFVSGIVTEILKNA